MGHPLDDGDFAAEAAVHLSEFDADVTASNDDEMLRKKVDLEHGGVGEVIDLVDAGEGWDIGAATYVEEDLWGFEQVFAHSYCGGGFELCVAGVDGAVGIGPQAGFDAVARFEEDFFFAGFDGLHVDGEAAGNVDAVEGGAACHLHGVGVGDEGLGRDAAGVDAGSAEELALDDGDLLAGGGETSCEGGTGLAGSNDDGVELGHGCLGCEISVRERR